MATHAEHDYYGDLGVMPAASQEEVEKTYRRRVAILSSSPRKDAPARLAAVEAAYAVLHDSAGRTSYDAFLRDHPQRNAVKSTFGWDFALDWLDVICYVGFGILKGLGKLFG